jgi:RND family efflux transporter MFP subunit
VDRPSPQSPSADGELLSIITRAQTAETYDAALRQLCLGLGQWTGAERVILGITNRRGEAQVAALSDEVRIDRRSEMLLAAEAALDETLAQDEITFWNTADGEQSPIFRRLTRLASADVIVGIPLRTEDGTGVGAVLLCGPQPLADLQPSTTLPRCQAPIAACLGVLHQAHGGAVNKLQAAWSRVRRQLRGRFVAATIAVLGGLLILPVPFKVKSDFTVEPVSRRYIAAPFDGTLDKTFVEPGDLVESGQVLAGMDERELRWELDGLEAQFSAAKKKRDVALATREASTAQLAALEMEQLDTKIQTIKHRLEHLKIQCPIDGVVVSGDLKRTEGAPLSIGQTLFEVAPLDKMIAEIEVPQAEVTHIREGMSVALRFDSVPGHSWSGTVAKVHPRAELRHDQTVFIADVQLENVEEQLRPGMSGRAKISAENRSLGWILFHRPLYALAQRIGW